MRRLTLLIVLILFAAPFVATGTETPAPAPTPTPEAPADEAPVPTLEIAEAPNQSPADSLEDLRQQLDPHQDGLFRALRACTSSELAAHCPAHCAGCVVSNNIFYCYGC